MEYSIGELATAKQAIEGILKSEMQGKLAFKLGKILRLIKPDVDDFEKHRNELLKKYGTLSAKGEWLFDNDNFKNFESELNPILELKSNIDIEKIKQSELENINCEGRFLIGLNIFIDEE